jgi:RNA polymerase sigma-70 factor (ECF subfamily)
MRYFGPGVTLVSNPLGDRPVVLAFLERRLYGVILLDVDNHAVQKVHVTADPEKLGFLSNLLARTTNAPDV